MQVLTDTSVLKLIERKAMTSQEHLITTATLDQTVTLMDIALIVVVTMIMIIIMGILETVTTQIMMIITTITMMIFTLMKTNKKGLPMGGFFLLNFQTTLNFRKSFFIRHGCHFILVNLH
jgi:hypothetical protein